MLEVPRCEAWDFSVTCSRKESSCDYPSAAPQSESNRWYRASFAGTLVRSYAVAFGY
jgi:hypothetical protein